MSRRREWRTQRRGKRRRRRERQNWPKSHNWPGGSGSLHRRGLKIGLTVGCKTAPGQAGGGVEQALQVQEGETGVGEGEEGEEGDVGGGGGG